MARRRMIDPNFWESEGLARCSLSAKLLFMGLISFADDEGRGRANLYYLKSRIFTYDDGIDHETMKQLMIELARNVSVVFYRVSEREYYQLLNWKSWQRIDRPSPSRIQSLDEVPGEFLYGSSFCKRSVQKESLSANGRRDLMRGRITDVCTDNRDILCAEVIAYLNRMAGTSYRKDTVSSQKLISKRAEEGYSKQDLCLVIDKKCQDWLHTNLQRFLRPQTLFGDKFESYLNQPMIKLAHKKKQMDHAQHYDMRTIETVLYGME